MREIRKDCDRMQPRIRGLINDALIAAGDRYRLTPAGIALRDLYHGVYDRLVAINVYLEDELRHD